MIFETDQFKSGAKKERETRSFVVDLKYPVQEQKIPLKSTAASSISSTSSSSTDNTPYMQQVRVTMKKLKWSNGVTILVVIIVKIIFIRSFLF